jgi:hypothetical protein
VRNAGLGLKEAKDLWPGVLSLSAEREIAEGGDAAAWLRPVDRAIPAAVPS